MKFSLHIVLALCFSLSLKAQTDSLHALLPMLGSLSAEQKEKVLDYAHYLGAYYGKGLEATCKLLDARSQGRVMQYIGVLKKTGKPEPTTVQWLRDTLSYKEIDEGFIYMDSFTVINIGAAPYIIHSTKSGCDCTVLHYPDFPVMPGDTATVRVEFDSSKKVGRAQPGVILYDNSRPNRRNILYLDGIVLPKKAVKVIRN